VPSLRDRDRHRLLRWFQAAAQILDAFSQPFQNALQGVFQALSLLGASFLFFMIVCCHVTNLSFFEFFFPPHDRFYW
jgi:hypothetical protein